MKFVQFIIKVAKSLRIIATVFFLTGIVALWNSGDRIVSTLTFSMIIISLYAVPYAIKKIFKKDIKKPNEQATPETYIINENSFVNPNIINESSFVNPAADSSPDAQTIYFKRGKLYKVDPPSSDGWYDARYLVSDGRKYDLENSEDIQKIPIPHFDKTDAMERDSVTRSLDYVIRMKASRARKRGLIAESDELYKKAIVLMQESGIIYDVRPYLYFAKSLLKEGRFRESEKWEQIAYEAVEKQNKKLAYPYKTLAQKRLFNNLETCKKLKIDYVEIMYLNGTCEKCAPYQGRVYCLSGKDKRFPKFPEFIKIQGCIHEGCRHPIRPFHYPECDTIYFRDQECDAIEISNRAFYDDRTTSEKHSYENILKEISKQNAPYITKNEKEYYRIKYVLPQKAPKSLSAYTRMKNAGTENFIELAESANAIGIDISM